MGDEHSGESLIKTPKQLVAVVALGILVPVLAAAMLAYFVVTSSKSAEKNQAALEPKAVAARIKPVAEVTIAGEEGGGAKASQSAEQIVQQYCAACHTTGAAGAPKIGDKSAWAKRIGEGLDQLMKTSIAGKGAMPPRGGAASLSDAEMARAVVYMANQSGGKFKESTAPKAKGTAATERSGEQVVQAACIRCHESGKGGAPKIGDKAAWSQRVSQGVAAVTQSAIRGHGKMPARGGLANLTDKEVTSAILYMFGRAGDQSALKKSAAK